MGKRKSENLDSQASKRNRKVKRNESQYSNEDDAEASTSMEPMPASQPIWSQQALSQERLKRSGKVIMVKLKNFMCHRNLVVDFNSRTNLVVGANGSGKSAILTALIIGLGSKANATNRSSSVKQFIRTGEQSATIEIHLANDGGDSYERDRYGDRIIVIRHITDSGTSSYKIQDCNGRTISKSRTDLLKMALFMNIQVDNPVCVMTQDATRSFLRDSNPKMQYKLFLKATQLDIIIERLNECISMLKQSKTKFDYHKQAHESLKKQQEEIERKKEQFQSMEPLRAEIRKCKIEAQWRKVADQESLMHDINTTHEDSNREKTKLEKELNKWSNIEQIHQEIKDFRDVIKTMSTTLAVEQERLGTEKTVWKRKNENVLEQEREMKKGEIRCTKIQDKIQKLEESIRNEVSTDKDRLERIRQENDMKLAELKEKQSDLEATIKSHTHEKDLFVDANTNYRQQIETIDDQRTQLTQEKRNVEHALRNIRESAESRLRHYGSYMPDLIEDLEKAVENGELSEMPIGPFAQHIEVTIPKYRQFIEDTIGRLTLAFCVNNDDDAEIFRELLEKHEATHIPTITAQFTDDVYNTDLHAVARNKYSIRIMDAIRVDNPMVMNCLIDMCGVDTILLTENMEYAKRITSIKENVPANLTRIIVTNPYGEFYPAPMYRTYSKKSAKGRNLRVSEADSERTYTAELDTITKRMEELSVECANIRAKIAENNKRIDERIKTIVRTEKFHKTRQLEIDEIESIEYQDGIDTTIMTQEIAEQTKLLEQENERYEAARTKYDELKAEIKAGNSTITELKKNYHKMEQEMADKQRTKDDMEEKIRKCESMCTHYQKKIQTIVGILDKLSKERLDAVDKLNRLEAAAQKAGDRVNNPETEEKLEAIIRRNERKINAVVSSSDTLEDIMQQHEEIVARVQQSGELHNILQKSLHVLSASVKTRFRMVTMLKNTMKTRITFSFVKIMDLRKCAASLEFDDKAESLKIEVTPRDKIGDKTVSKLTNLSGGERSYVTVAFLLSLWACVDHPFYFLDEYDVFTDEVNRNYMTKMLLREANIKSTYQYTFLTPQNITDISATPDLSILRLDKPDR